LSSIYKYMYANGMCVDSTMAGLDASLIGNLNTLPAFQYFFGTLSSTIVTGYIFSSMQASCSTIKMVSICDEWTC
jgi:hypothetical protein